jgi:hypothetical protein
MYVPADPKVIPLFAVRITAGESFSARFHELIRPVASVPIQPPVVNQHGTRVEEQALAKLLAPFEMYMPFAMMPGGLLAIFPGRYFEFGGMALLKASIADIRVGLVDDPVAPGGV